MAFLPLYSERLTSLPSMLVAERSKSDALDEEIASAVTSTIFEKDIRKYYLFSWDLYLCVFICFCLFTELFFLLLRIFEAESYWSDRRSRDKSSKWNVMIQLVNSESDNSLINSCFYSYF